MSVFRRFWFNLWYFRRPPWDSGVTPPELRELIRDHLPGRAIDLGCGTGTNAISLAQNGWHVAGVDFASRAIEIARRKARAAGMDVDFRVDDVTRLRDVIGPFDLALDIGCFHSLPTERRGAYLDTVYRILVPGGAWLLYGFTKPDESVPGVGLAPRDVQALTRQFRLVRREDGNDPGGHSSAWFWLEKPPLR
jgi:ubiquinone/menaquinone biosynthesis C-methylase UbiE